MLTPELRRQGIGASEIASVAGIPGAFETPFGVWARKVGEAREQDDAPHLRAGRMLEAGIVAWFQEEAGRQVSPCPSSFRHRSHHWAFATPDGLVLAASEVPHAMLEGVLQGPVEGVLEAKLVTKASDWGDEGDDIPLAYRCQVEWQMECTGLPVAYVAALILPWRFKHFRIERDPELAAMLLEAGQEFWETYVVPRVPPPVDGSDAAGEYLRRRFPQHNTRMRMNTPEADELAKQLLAVKATIKELETDEARLAQGLQAIIGDAEGIDGGSWRATWKKTASRGVDWKQMAHDAALDTPARCREYEREGTRTFRIAPKK